MTIQEIERVYKSSLFSVAYQLIGEIAASEDIVQEVFIKWCSIDKEPIVNPKAYLIKSVVNQCLNYLECVKRERTLYKGVWLPEPLVNTSDQIDAQVDLPYGFSVLLQKLSPTERAVFILKECFGFEYVQLSDTLEIQEANCRQLYHRAKIKLPKPAKRMPINNQQRQALLEAFTKASHTGELQTLIKLFKTDIELYSDGGGKVAAAIKPLLGIQAVARFLESLATKHAHDLAILPAEVNGELAFQLVRKSNHQLDSVLIITVVDAGISQLFFVRNPDKLRHIA